MKWVVLVAAVTSTLFGASAADDEICNRLHQFESASVVATTKGAASRDWIEFRWTGQWLSETGWGWSCTHTNSEASKALCTWLGHNSSIEFHMNLPIRILACYGARLPRDSIQIGTWVSSIQLDPGSGDEYSLLEIAVGSHRGDDVIRYSVFVGPAAEQKYPLPPLFPPADFTGEN